MPVLRGGHPGVALCSGPGSLCPSFGSALLHPNVPWTLGAGRGAASTQPSSAQSRRGRGLGEKEGDQD